MADMIGVAAFGR